MIFKHCSTNFLSTKEWIAASMATPSPRNDDIRGTTVIATADKVKQEAIQSAIPGSY